MKYFILILFFATSALSHEPHVSIDELTRWQADKLKDKHRNLYQKISDQVVLELAKKGNNVYAQQSAAYYIPHESKHKENSIWFTLTRIRFGMHWSLKALDTAFEKGACVGSVLSDIKDYSRAFKWYMEKKQYYTENELILLESLKSLYPYYYASLYVTEKLYAYLYEASPFPKSKWTKGKVLQIPKFDRVKNAKDKISKLSQKKQKEVWDLVKLWEKKWAKKLYNINSHEDCFALNQKEVWEIDKEAMLRLLEAIH